MRPCDALELKLTEIWEATLEIQPIGLQDNFFDLGGHSLMAVRLLAQIESQLGQKLQLATLFQSGTIEGLAQEIRSAMYAAISNQQSASQLVRLNTDKLNADTLTSSFADTLNADTLNADKLFFAHGSDGNVWAYYELARQLGGALYRRLAGAGA